MKKSAMRLDRLVSVALVHPATRFIPVPSGPRVPILMYHGIRRELGRRGPYFETNTSPDVFAAHMRFLKRSGYETVTPGEALAYVTGKADGRKRVAITFDDGYSDFYTDAFPVLSGLGLQATMFVVSGFAQSGVAHSGAACMDWKQIREIQDHGIEIGSHTATHPELWRLSPPALEQELAHSKDTIAERLGTSVRSFSHPFAFPEENKPYVERLTALLRQHGYQNGVSTVIGTANARHSRYVLPRIPVNSHDDLPLFRAKLEGGYDWLHMAQRFYKSYVKRTRPVTCDGKPAGRSTMKPAMDLSIIIVNWRSLGDLQACLHSVQRETREITYEIFVIDNASGDGSEAVIRHDFPQVIFLQSERNLGFAAANNLAYRHSSGDIVAFLNPDTEIDSDVFTRMVAHLRRDPATGAVGARLLNTDGSLQTSCVQAYPTIWNQLVDSALLRRLFPAWRVWGSEALLSQTGQPCEVDAISGACFVVRREVFEHVGLFTETYFMYVEDLDLSYKISEAGYRICYLPDCCVTHHGGRSSAQQDPNFASLRQRESVLQFFEGTRGSVYSRCYRGTVAVSAAMRMALVILSVPLGPLVLRGNDRGALLRKWWAHLRWAIAVRPANAPHDSPLQSRLLNSK